jgi:hypothetical protein
VSPFDLLVAQATQQKPAQPADAPIVRNHGSRAKLPGGTQQRLRAMALEHMPPRKWFTGPQIEALFHEHVSAEASLTQLAVVLANLSANRANPFLFLRDNPDYKKGRGKYLYSRNPDWVDVKAKKGGKK